MNRNNNDDSGVQMGAMVAGGVGGILTLGFGFLLGWMFKTRIGRRVLLAIVAGLALLFLGKVVWVAFQDGSTLCYDSVAFRYNFEQSSQIRKNIENKGKSPRLDVLWTDLSERASHVQKVRFDWVQGDTVVRSKTYECRVAFDGTARLDRVAGK